MRRGDVVLLAFPFSDGRGSKVRPALVVQADRNNKRLSNTIVAMITSVPPRVDTDTTQIRINIDSPAGKRSGLLHDSTIKCANLFTIHQHMIVRVIGHLPEKEMKRVDACLLAALGLR